MKIEKFPKLLTTIGFCGVVALAGCKNNDEYELVDAKTDRDQYNATASSSGVYSVKKDRMEEADTTANSAAQQQDSQLAANEAATQQQGNQQQQESIVPVEELPVEALAREDSTVYFGFGSAELDAEAKEKLRNVADYISNNKDRVDAVQIEGYTDNVGSDQYNQQLSRQRAQQVEEFLRDAGIEVGQWDVEPRGENNPIATNSTAAGRAENRRVQITVEPGSQQTAHR